MTLFSGVLALDAAHYALVRHERCPEHQEIVHGHGPVPKGHGHEAMAHAHDPGVDTHRRLEAADGRTGLRSSPPAAAGHEHEVCVLALFVDPESGDLSASKDGRRTDASWAAVLSQAPTRTMGPMPVLFLAPKTSPPNA